VLPVGSPPPIVSPPPSPMPVPTPPPTPTSCVCGNTTIAIGSFCATCNKDSGFWFFSHTKWYYAIYNCAADGNLSYVTANSTTSHPAVCTRNLMPATCVGYNCHQ